MVRVYRRDADDPERILGLIDIVGKDEQRSFSSFGDLRKILLSSKQKWNEPDETEAEHHAISE